MTLEDKVEVEYAIKYMAKSLEARWAARKQPPVATTVLAVGGGERSDSGTEEEGHDAVHQRSPARSRFGEAVWDIVVPGSFERDNEVVVAYLEDYVTERNAPLFPVDEELLKQKKKRHEEAPTPTVPGHLVEGWHDFSRRRKFLSALSRLDDGYDIENPMSSYEKRFVPDRCGGDRCGARGRGVGCEMGGNKTRTRGDSKDSGGGDIYSVSEKNGAHDAGISFGGLADGVKCGGRSRGLKMQFANAVNDDPPVHVGSQAVKDSEDRNHVFAVVDGDADIHEWEEAECDAIGEQSAPIEDWNEASSQHVTDAQLVEGDTRAECHGTSHDSHDHHSEKRSMERSDAPLRHREGDGRKQKGGGERKASWRVSEVLNHDNGVELHSDFKRWVEGLGEPTTGVAVVGNQSVIGLRDYTFASLRSGAHDIHGSWVKDNSHVPSASVSDLWDASRESGGHVGDVAAHGPPGSDGESDMMDRLLERSLAKSPAPFSASLRHILDLISSDKENMKSTVKVADPVVKRRSEPDDLLDQLLSGTPPDPGLLHAGDITEFIVYVARGCGVLSLCRGDHPGQRPGIDLGRLLPDEDLIALDPAFKYVAAMEVLTERLFDEEIGIVQHAADALSSRMGNSASIRNKYYGSVVNLEDYMSSLSSLCEVVENQLDEAHARLHDFPVDKYTQNSKCTAEWFTVMRRYDRLRAMCCRIHDILSPLKLLLEVARVSQLQLLQSQRRVWVLEMEAAKRKKMETVRSFLKRECDRYDSRRWGVGPECGPDSKHAAPADGGQGGRAQQVVGNHVSGGLRSDDGWMNGSSSAGGKGAWLDATHVGLIMSAATSSFVHTWHAQGNVLCKELGSIVVYPKLVPQVISRMVALSSFMCDGLREFWEEVVLDKKRMVRQRQVDSISIGQKRRVQRLMQNASLALRYAQHLKGSPMTRS